MVSRAMSDQGLAQYQAAQEAEAKRAQFYQLLQALRAPQGASQPQQAKPGDGIASLGKLFGGGGAAAGGGYGLKELLGGGSAVSPMGLSDTAFLPAGANFATSEAAVGTAANGGTLLANGTVAGGAGPFSLSGIGAGGNLLLPAAGAVGAFDVLSHDYGPARSGIEGALSGAAIGSYFNPATGGLPVGTLVGAGVGGAVGLGKSLLSKKSTREIQGDRWKAAKAAGASPDRAQIYGPGYDWFQGTGGEQSRDEKFLTPDAIRWNPDNYNNIPDWEKKSKADQDKFLTAMLGAGKVQEKKGGIYYDDDFAKQQASQIWGGGPAMIPTVAKAPAQLDPAKIPALINSSEMHPLPLKVKLSPEQLATVTSAISGQPAIKPAMIQRSQTSSPGISKSGRPLFYH